MSARSESALIAGHALRFDSQGSLIAWMPWRGALELEMAFYRSCPVERGYPRFASETFLDGDWQPHPDRNDTIPAMQNGTGIHSYLAWRRYAGDADGWLLAMARAMAQYLLNETLTPRGGAYPGMVRSTGRRGCFPQPADCGSQSDRPFEIEPDKSAIAACALLELAAATGAAAGPLIEHALHAARVLARHQIAADASRSPFPFRVDYRDGAGRGPVSGNMSCILRLYDALLARDFREFAAPRAALWEWIMNCQIPSAAGAGALFAQFFEDHDTPTNRCAWAPLNLARYLLERGAILDSDWLDKARLLIEFTEANFTHEEFGTRVCHEQDEDRQAWGGINSTYGAVLALYAGAAGSAALALRARAALNFTLYCIDAAGRPRDLYVNAAAGGWQQDAHTDVIHNFVDALGAFPQWAV